MSLEDENLANKYADISLSMIEDGEDEKAIELCNKGLSIDKNNPKIALALSKAGEKNKAIDVFKRRYSEIKSISSDVDRTMEMSILAGAAKKAGFENRSKEMAKQCLQTINNMNESDQQYILNWGQWDSGDLPNMISAFSNSDVKRIVNIARNHTNGPVDGTFMSGISLSSIARALTANGNKSQAQKICQETLELIRSHPESPPDFTCHIYNNIGQAFLDMGERDKAVDIFEEGEEDMSSMGFSLDLVKGYARAGRYDKAMKIAEGIDEGTYRKNSALAILAKELAKGGETESP